MKATIKKVQAGFYVSDQYEILFLRSYWRINTRDGKEITRFVSFADAKAFVVKAGA
jgi:hypothetical protein